MLINVIPKAELGPCTSCCLLLCQVRAKEGCALQTPSSPSRSPCVSGPVGPFKALWVVSGTLNFTQSCLGSQGGVPAAGAASRALSQHRALLSVSSGQAAEGTPERGDLEEDNISWMVASSSALDGTGWGVLPRAF